MKMYIKSIMVESQDQALDFYTNTLGFEVKQDVPVGEYRWLTLVSPQEPDGVELGLEPNAHPASRVFQEALKADGIPWTAFRVDDLEAEVERLKTKGVSFTQLPMTASGASFAVFDDTCGNLIQLIELHDE